MIAQFFGSANCYWYADKQYPCSIDAMTPDLTPQRLSTLFDAIDDVRILVVGDLMLDVYLRGSASRISPEAPVPVVRVSKEVHAPGGAANVAANVLALGAACTVVGCIGSDQAGDELGRALEEAGADSSSIYRHTTRPTTVKTRLMVRHQQVARFDQEVEDDMDGQCVDDICAAIESAARHAHVMVVEDYDKGICTPRVIDAVLDASQRFGLPLVVDPKHRRFFDYRGATVFKPNRLELAAGLRAPVLADDPAWMERTRRQLDCGSLLVTLGEEGMALMTEEGQFLRIPAMAREVFDVSGAGDTVTAVVATALAAGASMVEAAILANYAAGIEVGKPGVKPVRREELLTAVHAEDPGIATLSMTK